MKKATELEKQYMGMVAELPCCLCGDRPVEVHHVREQAGIGLRPPHFLTVPLCCVCHRGPSGVHGTKAFQRIYGKSNEAMLSDTIGKIFRELTR